MSTLFDLMVKIGVDDSAFAKGLSDAKTKALSAGSGIAKGLGGTAMKGLGMAAQAGVAAVGAAATAVSAFGAKSVKTGMSFDTAMSQVAATLGLSMSDIQNNVNGAGETFEKLSAKAQDSGASTIYSATEASEGLNILAMSGYSADESISMLDDVLHLAAAGSMDMASAAAYVSGTMKGFNDETKGAGYYADLMAKGATLANTSVQQLGEAMSSGAAGAKAYGQDAESMTLSLLRLAEQGEVGSAAGTALAAAMKNLYSPTNQAKKALDSLNVKAFDPVTKKARDFNTVVNELDAALSSYTDEEKAAIKQTIFGIQGLDAFNKMTVTSTEKQEQWADALSKASGESMKQYGTMTDNLEGDLAGLNSAFEAVQISISKGLTPTFRNFVKLGTDGLTRINEALKHGGMTEAAREAGSIFGDLAKEVTSMVPDIITAAGELLDGLAEGFAENAGDLAESAINIVSAIADGISKPDAILTLIEGVDQMLGQLATRMEEADPSEFAAGLESIVSRAATSLGDNAAVLLPAAAKLVGDFALALTAPDNIQTILGGATDLITGLGTGLVEAAPELAGRVPEILDNIVTGFDLSIPKLLGKLAGSLNNMLSKLFDPSNFNVSGLIKSLLTGQGLDLSQLFSGALHNFEIGRNAGQQFLDAYYETIGAGKGSSTHGSKGGGSYGGSGGSWGPAQEVTNEARAAAQEAAEITNEAHGFVGRARVVIDDANAAAQAAAANTTQAAANAAQAAATVTTATQTVASATGQAQTQMANSTQAAAGALTTTAANAQKAGNTVTQTMNQAAASVSWDTLIESSQAAAQGVQDAFKETPDWFGRQFQIAAENIKSAFAPLPNEFAAIWQLIKNAFKVSEAQTWGRDMIQGFTNGVNALKPALIASIEDLAAKVKAILGHSHPTEGPMKDDYTWMPDMMDLFISGIRDNEDRLQQTAAHAFDLSDSVTEPTMTYSTASAGGGSASGEAYSLEAKLDQVLTLLNAELPQLANRSVVLDTGAVVGGILPQVDAGLGRRYAYAGRDNA